MEELCSDKEYPRILDMNKSACEVSILIQSQWKETRVCSIQNMCSTRKGGGHCVLKWSLCGHLKPPPSATITVMFEVISIKFW